jgi:tetratricopeptide (TPR) repeat protein
MTGFGQLLERHLSARARWIVTLAAGAAAALTSCTGVREFDQWFHMAWGRAWVNGGFPAHDPFLFPFLDKPALGNGEWLGSVGIFLSWLAGGIPGTVLLVGLLVGATVALLVWDGLEGDEPPRWVDVLVTLVVVVLALGVIRRRAVARPEIFGFPALAWTLWAARRWIEGRGRAILAFPVVALIWTNTHTTVLYGLGTVFVFAVEGLVRGQLGGEGGRALRTRGLQLAAVGAAGTLLSLFSLGGASPVFQGIRYAFDLFGIRFGPAIDPETQHVMNLMHGVIIELQPPDLEYYLSSVGGVIALLAVGALVALVAWRKARFAELALAAIGLLIATRAARFMPLFGVLAVACTSRNLRAGIARIPARLGVLRWGIVPAVPAAAYWAFAVIPIPISFGEAEEIFPAYVADVLVKAGAPSVPGLRVYNTFHYGGYLEWRLGAPVLYNDGRLTWPPGEAEIAMTAGGRNDVDRLDARWGFDALVLENLRFMNQEMRRSIQTLAFDVMADRERFALVALDDAAQLYVRRDGRLGYLAAQEYRVVSPSRVPTDQDLDDPFFVTRFRAEFARAAAANPASVYCKLGLYYAHLIAGDADAARRIFPEDTPLPRTKHPLGNGSMDAIHDGLAALAKRRMFEAADALRAGRPQDAERLYRISVLASESSAARNKLGLLEADRGEFVGAEKQFRRAIQLDAAFLEPRLHLATLLVAVGRPDAAREIFAALAKHAPQSSEGRAAQQRLEAMDQRIRVGR